MSATLWDLFLATLAGILAGLLLSPASRLKPAAERPIALLVSAVIEPLFYWTDLRGPDGRPSHSKVAYFLTLLVGLWGLVLFARHERAAHAAGVADVSWGFLAYAALVFGLGLGKQTFNAILTFLAGRFPGAPPRLSGGQPAPPTEHS